MDHHDAFRRLVERLTALGYRVASEREGVLHLIAPEGIAETYLEVSASDWDHFVAAHPTGFDPVAFADDLVRELRSSVRPIVRAGIHHTEGVAVWFTERAGVPDPEGFAGPGWYAGQDGA